MVVSRFPAVTETFILREIGELERQGQPVLLVPLLRENPAVVHAEAAGWVARALYTPFLSVPILAANLRALRRGPRRYLSLLARVALGSLPGLNTFTGALGVFPKSVYLAERLRAEGVGHVHAHFATHPATAALIIGAFADIPFSFTPHAHDIFLRRLRPLLRQKIAAARFVRAISDYNRDLLERLYPVESRGKIRVVHMGIDPSRYGAAHGDGNHAPATIGAKILCVAGLRPYKGVSVLIEACRLLRDAGMAVRCEIVGDGPERQKVEAAVRTAALEDRVSLLGARPQEEVTRLLASATVFVAPSVVTADGWMDGIPVALMEAMAAEVPVVASAISGIPELIEDGISGILVPPGSAPALADAIGQLVTEPKLRERIRCRARRKVSEAFRLETCAAELLQELDRHNPAPPAPLLERLEAVAGTLADVRAIGMRRVHQRVDSVVAELLVAGATAPAEIVMKIHAEQNSARSARERAGHEFAVLSRLRWALHENGGSAGDPAGSGPMAVDGVPRPIALDEDTASLLMETCRGQPLDQLIRDSRLTRDPGAWAAFEEALAGAGRWLARFQKATTAPLDTTPFLADLVKRARRDLASTRAELPRDLPRHAKHRLEDLASAVSAGGAPVAGHHCDYWPGNVFIGSGGIQVIDFEGFRYGLAEEDLAYFIVHLELFFPIWLLRRCERARSAFLSGYVNAGGLAASGPAYALCRLGTALQLLARTNGRPPGAWLVGRDRRERLLRGIATGARP